MLPCRIAQIAQAIKFMSITVRARPAQSDLPALVPTMRRDDDHTARPHAGNAPTRCLVPLSLLQLVCASARPCAGHLVIGVSSGNELLQAAPSHRRRRQCCSMRLGSTLGGG
jgi:hypothetical protein